MYVCMYVTVQCTERVTARNWRCPSESYSSNRESAPGGYVCMYVCMYVCTVLYVYVCISILYIMYMYVSVYVCA